MLSPVPDIAQRWTLRGLTAALLLTMAGCASSYVPASGGEPTGAVEARLRSEVRSWEGTPHHLGGTGRRGVDCSGFVMAVYRDAFRLNLPRTTEHQVRAGRRVRTRELQAGDLVFFRPEPKTRHVGIYLSGGEFAHASASYGVTTSRLDEPYWRTAYWTSRRVLPAPPRAPAPPPGGESGGETPPFGPQQTTPTGRIGW